MARLKPLNLSTVPGARLAPMPRKLSPQLATLVEKSPKAGEWIS